MEQLPIDSVRLFVASIVPSSIHRWLAVINVKCVFLLLKTHFLTGRKPQKKGQEERVKEGIHFFFLSFFSKFQSAGFVDGMSGPGRICLLIEQTT